MAMNFPLDRAVQSFLADPEPADEYRLFVTFDGPASNLMPFLVSADDTDALLPGIPTRRFRLALDRVWTPEGERWKRLGELDRHDVAEFLDRFVIETNCPASSHDLRHPGPLDDALMSFLVDRIGVTRPPNGHLDLASSAAHLILRAQQLRAGGSVGSATDATAALGLRIDYDRVEETLPLDQDRLVGRSNELAAMTSAIEGGARLVVSGPPGAGKSWLLHLFRNALKEDGWVVALHFCFVDLVDQARNKRTTTTTMFGSLISELLDADSDLASDLVPRYSAGPRELETLLQAGVDNDPNRRIAIIIDGIDHADRVSAHQPSASAAVDICEELAALELPAGVALIVGSQPGEHLTPLGDDVTTHTVSPWGLAEMRELAQQIGICSDEQAGFEANTLVDAIAERSSGNPLYATYLSRTIKEARERDSEADLETTDLVDLVLEAPPFDADLDAYYRWLLETLENDQGAIHVAHLMSIIDFAVTTDDLLEVFPMQRSLINSVISRLAPLLADEPAMGGLRIYHESFQRYLRQHAQDADTNFEAIVTPAISWLEGRGFERDHRAFRSMFGLLQLAGRHDEVVDRVGVGFVSGAIGEGQPGDAVTANLRLAASSAASLGRWPDLARLVELARSADYLYHWRFNDEEIAEEYGRGYAALRGSSALAMRLLHDGRCTFLPRPGLVLCQLCEELGVPAPWAEYLAADNALRSTDSTTYLGQNNSVELARVMGQFRVAGLDVAVRQAAQWLNKPADAPVHSLDVARVLADLFGIDALTAVRSQINSNPGRAWVTLVCSERQDDMTQAASLAAEAVSEGLPAKGLRVALHLGAKIDNALAEPPDLLALSAQVGTNDARLLDNVLDHWFLALDLAAAIGDNEALTLAEAVIPADSWYRRWLRFVVLLRRTDVRLEAVLSELSGLGRDFGRSGDGPRLIDLFPLHQDIQATFCSLLNRISDDDHWSAAADSLAQISKGSTTELHGSRSGPLPIDVFFRMLIATAGNERRVQIAAETCKSALHPSDRSSEYYDTHAVDQILLARLLLATGERSSAEAAWLEACRYLPAYGFRKDVTVFEIIDNLDAIAEARPDMLKCALERLHPLTEAVLVHTDQRSTNWAIHNWIDAAGRHDPASTLAFLGKSGLSEIPSSGDLDHGMASALAALSPSTDPEVIVAGWIGIGAAVRDQPIPGIAAAESEATPGWDIIIGALLGDGQAAPDSTAERVVNSAVLMKKSHPAVSEAERDSSLGDDSYSGAAVSGVEFEIGPDPTPLQVVRSVRRWRGDARRAPVSTVAEAAATCLLALADGDRPSEAEVLLGRLARDTPLWEPPGFLQGLAHTLLREGPARLGAIAATYAYTRTNDGWHRFGGRDQQHQFLDAIGSDPEAALETLLSEVADAVRTGGDMGVNRHLVEVLAAAGLKDDAWAVWSEACRVIESRLPGVGEVDAIEVAYESTSLGPEAALSSAMLARLNHASILDRQAAVAGLARLIRRPGGACAGAVDLAALHAPASVLTSLLALLEKFEPAPYDTTLGSVHALRAIASGPRVVARVIARSLLERVGINTLLPPSASMQPFSSIPSDRFRALTDQFGRARLETVNAEWDEFSGLAVHCLELAIQSDDLKKRMRTVLPTMDGGRNKHLPKLWWPIDEERHEILERVGASARANRAVAGDIDPTVEVRVARALIPDVALSERLTGSRCPRPTFRVSPLSEPQWRDEVGSTMITEPVVIPDGEYEGWLVIAHHETELLVEAGHSHTVDGQVETWSSLGFQDEPLDLKGFLPFGHGQLQIWTEECLEQPRAFSGPLACFHVAPESFGTVTLLSPHETLVTAKALRPAPPSLGLVMSDNRDEVALRLRTWREHTLGDDLKDWEHRISGMDLIARPDVVEAVKTHSTEKKLVAASTRTEAKRPEC